MLGECALELLGELGGARGDCGFEVRVIDERVGDCGWLSCVGIVVMRVRERGLDARGFCGGRGGVEGDVSGEWAHSREEAVEEESVEDAFRDVLCEGGFGEDVEGVGWRARGSIGGRGHACGLGPDHGGGASKKWQAKEI